MRFGKFLSMIFLHIKKKCNSSNKKSELYVYICILGNYQDLGGKTYVMHFFLKRIYITHK